MFVVLVLGVVLGSAGWLFTSKLVSFATSDGPEYVVATQSGLRFALWTASACLILLAFHRSRRDIAPLYPIALLALPLLAIALLATPLRAHAPPLLYFFVDLRWWLLAGVVVLVANGMMTRSGFDWRAIADGFYARAAKWLIDPWDAALVLVYPRLDDCRIAEGSLRILHRRRRAEVHPLSRELVSRARRRHFIAWPDRRAVARPSAGPGRQRAPRRLRVVADRTRSRRRRTKAAGSE